MKNKYKVQGDTTVIYCKDSEVYIDTMELDKVSALHGLWSIRVNNGKPYVVMQHTENGKRVMTRMGKYILGLTNPKDSVMFMNDNHLDCRRINMSPRLGDMIRNEYTYHEGFVEIQLKCGRVTKVSIDTFESKIKHIPWTWYFKTSPCGKKGYVVGSRMTYLHRVILGTPDGYVTDHINGDTLDNLDENLRVATSSQNNMNRKGTWSSTGVKGVSLRDNGKYRVRVGKKHIGDYLTLEQATEVAEKARREAYGEWA